MEKINIKVDSINENVRLDIFIESQIDKLSRSRIKTLIDDKMIFVNNKNQKASYKTKENDNIEINIPKLKEISAKPQDIRLDIVYEDKDIIVINKPKGLVTHPAPGSEDGTLVNALMYHCNDLSGIGGSLRPGIVHRIDKDTTGLLVVAKNDLAHQDLSKQISEKSAKRFYKAIVIGNFIEDEGIINKPIARNSKDRKKMAIDPEGREAITHWKVLERFGKFTLLELELKTGRTHQIRVHLAHIKHGIIGDDVYGPDIKIPVNLQGQALHAYKLILTHPITKEEMTFVANEPLEFKKLLDYVRKIT
ncbi:MAG: RluA family pseudouridine synthase [Candidatus Sericytochromatia bacterium]